MLIHLTFNCSVFQEPLRLQLKVFMEEVQQQKVLPTIRSYLKLYTTMPLDKMAGFMELQPEDFRDNLLAFKHKMKNVVWTKVMWSSVCVCSFHEVFSLAGHLRPGGRVQVWL